MTIIESIYNTLVQSGVLKWLIYLLLFALVIRYTPILIDKIGEQVTLKKGYRPEVTPKAGD